MSLVARVKIEENLGRQLDLEVQNVAHEEAAIAAQHYESMRKIRYFQRQISLQTGVLCDLPFSLRGCEYKMHVRELCLINIEKSKLYIYLLQTRETVNFATLQCHVAKIKSMIEARAIRLRLQKQQVCSALKTLTTKLH
jgi:hypothetical protein